MLRINMPNTATSTFFIEIAPPGCGRGAPEGREGKDFSRRPRGWDGGILPLLNDLNSEPLPF